MPTAEYIKRDDALFELNRYASARDPVLMISYRVDLCERIEKIPAVDVEPVRHGSWIWDDEGFHCSECWFHAYGDTGEVLSGHYLYCPHCGARLEGGDND